MMERKKERVPPSYLIESTKTHQLIAKPARYIRAEVSKVDRINCIGRMCCNVHWALLPPNSDIGLGGLAALLRCGQAARHYVRTVRRPTDSVHDSGAGGTRAENSTRQEFQHLPETF